MSRAATPQGLMPSLLDRLIDPETAGSVGRYGYAIDQVIHVVRRDLEDLLNTRQTCQDLPPEFRDCHRSVIAFGLPELSTIRAVTPQQRDDIGRTIEAIVALFEPRLKRVKATLIDAGTEGERSVRFRIDALLSVDPAPEVAFDTILELATGHYIVRPGE